MVRASLHDKLRKFFRYGRARLDRIDVLRCHGRPGNASTYSIEKSGKVSTNLTVKSGKASTNCHSPHRSGNDETMRTFRSGNDETTRTSKSANASTTSTRPQRLMPRSEQLCVMGPSLPESEVAVVDTPEMGPSLPESEVAGNGIPESAAPVLDEPPLDWVEVVVTVVLEPPDVSSEPVDDDDAAAVAEVVSIAVHPTMTM